MLPQFPLFKKLELSDRVAVEEATKLFPPYSDHHFSGMWCWDTAETVELSSYKGGIVFKLHDYLTNEPCLSFLGQADLADTAQVLLEFAFKNSLGRCLKLIPEEITQQLIKTGEFSAKADRNNFDYILSIQTALDLGSSTNKSTRKSINQFTRSYPNSEVTQLDVTDAATQANILTAFKKWSNGSSQKNEYMELELTALKRFFMCANDIETETIGLFVEGSMIGLSIEELVNVDYAMGHFQKANRDYQGAYQYLNYCVNQNLDKQKVKFVNIEQDLGLIGIRSSKIAQHPIDYLAKYDITARE